MKVAVVTITNNCPNYGNQLQNLAVLKLLDKIDVSEGETLYNVDDAEYLCSFAHKIKNYIYVALKIGNYKERLREIRFQKFGRRFLRYSKPIKGTVPSELVEKYDFFLCGSDQIWNPTFSCNNVHLPYTFLEFAPEHKRVSFSASIGVSRIDEKYIDKFIKGLNGFKDISVRERKGAELVKELTGRDVTVLLDPTMLIEKKEWFDIMNKPKGIPDRYILCYFLGNLSCERNEELMSLSKMYDLDLIFLNSENKNEYQSVGPREFIYMFAHANLVCTDSFHGSAFSINFLIPFIVYNREDNDENMNSRIDTLLHKFDLESRKRENIEFRKVMDLDYSKAETVLLNEQNIAKDYLTSAFQLKEIVENENRANKKCF